MFANHTSSSSAEKYVRQEFRAHLKVKPDQEQQFLKQWEDYVAHLSLESVRCCKLIFFTNSFESPSFSPLPATSNLYKTLTPPLPPPHAASAMKDLFGLGRDLPDSEVEAMSDEQRTQLNRLHESSRSIGVEQRTESGQNPYEPSSSR